MSQIVGIDLGTTFSALAALNSIGRPDVIPNAEGERITRSAIFFDEPGRVLVGTEANNARRQAVARSVKWIKRDMGNPGYKFQAHGKTWTPPELSALIIKKLKQDCAAQIGDIQDAVITVPAYFDEARRKATMDAGAIAGLNVIAIVNEPTAAALFYAVTHNVTGKVLVYDFGGGTFDVTVLNIRGHEVTVIASEGNHRLGGVDLDNAIVDLWRKTYLDSIGEELTPNPELRAEYEDYAELDKHTLSTRDKVTRHLTGPNGQRLTSTLTRSQFEEAISSFIATTDMLTEVALDEAKCKPSAIDQVLLVGGTTRIPIVRQRLEKMFGRPPVTAVNVDEAVACGAAVYAGVRMLRQNPSAVPAGVAHGLRDVKHTDVCNRSYGTICLTNDAHTEQTKETNSVLIQKNTQLPTQTTSTYYTVRADQRAVNVRVTEADHDTDDPEYVKIVYSESIPLPAGRPAGRPIDVTYSYDINQRMHCAFKDAESGAVHQVEFEMGDMGATPLNVEKARETVNQVTVQ